jgi:hypothetical protein
VDLAVRELHRDLDGDLAVRRPEDGADVVGKLEALDGTVEVVTDDVQVRHLRALAGLRVALGGGALLRLVDRGGRLVRCLAVSPGLTLLGLGGHHPSWDARARRQARPVC